MKRCIKCGMIKAIDQFGKDSTRKDRKTVYCKKCRAKYGKQYRQRPEVKERMQDYQYQYARTLKARQAQIKRNRKYNNTDKGRSLSRKIQAQRRQQLRNAPGEFPEEHWLLLLEAYDHTCAYCGRHESETGSLHREHLVPLSRGGRNDISNIRPSCRVCNSQKGKRTPEEAGMNVRSIDGLDQKIHDILRKKS